MIVIAHRGHSSAAPENTLAAVAAAISAGAGAVEIDVQLTGDRVPVVIHDTELDRTTAATGPVPGTTAAALAGVDAGSWFAPEFAGEPVPLLVDVLDVLTVADDVDLLLEVKGAWTPEDVRLVTDPIAERGLGARVVAQSFSVATVAALASVAPWLRRGLLVTEVGEGTLDLCRELGVSACNPHGQALRDNPWLVAEAHAAGLTVAPWTLNEPEQWAAAQELGVDGIITDRPDELLAWATARAA